MTTAEYAQLSNTLFFPTAFLLYVGAMAAYLFRMAFTRVDRDEGEPARAGLVVGRLGIGLVVLGLAAHLTSIVFRSLASGGRVPWGNMYEYSSVMGFGVVLATLLYVHWRLKRPELVGFLLLAALLTMAGAMMTFTEAGPLMPILESNWLKVHTSSAMAASTIFIVAFVFTGLYLLRDHAERRVAAQRTAGHEGSTVGAAYAPGTVAGDDPEAATTDVAVGDPGGRGELDPGEVGDDDAGYGAALRQAVNPWPIAIGATLVTLAYSWIFRNPIALVVAPLTVGGGVLLAWAFLPRLPAAATLDSLAYRTTAFAFPIWTFAVITGAIWAEQSWGRYWGWDPKETSAFVTWVAYAGYLHARATRGLRGRTAAIVGIVAFATLMFTYYAVNLWVVGLHSYAGL